MATALIAAWCSRRRRGLIFASTDQVFSGSRGPYREADAPAPTTTYGRTKAAAERFATAAGGLVVRLGWVLNDRPAAPRLDFIEHGLTRLQQGAIVDAAHDEHRTPVYSSELSAAILRLAEIGQAGAVHVAGNVHVTPYELLRTRAVGAGLDPTRVRPISRLKLAPAGRPRDVRLDTTLMQSLFAHSNRSLHA
jgi:dTDP-4-dehydrorhamnose reductase